MRSPDSVAFGVSRWSILILFAIEVEPGEVDPLDSIDGRFIGGVVGADTEGGRRGGRVIPLCSGLLPTLTGREVLP